MHEIGIAQEVLRIVEAKAREHGDGRVSRLRLRVGQFAGVQPDSLRFALEVCARGTRAEGAAVEIECTPASGICRRCRKEWTYVPGQMECPACAAKEIELRGGDELRVESFDME